MMGTSPDVLLGIVAIIAVIGAMSGSYVPGIIAVGTLAVLMAYMYYKSGKMERLVGAATSRLGMGPKHWWGDGPAMASYRPVAPSSNAPAAYLRTPPQAMPGSFGAPYAGEAPSTAVRMAQSNSYSPASGQWREVFAGASVDGSGGMAAPSARVSALTPAQASLIASEQNPYGNQRMYDTGADSLYTGLMAPPQDNRLARMAWGTSAADPDLTWYTQPDSTGVAQINAPRPAANYGPPRVQGAGYAPGGMWQGY
jgi:hypothetical protein